MRTGPGRDPTTMRSVSTGLFMWGTNISGNLAGTQSESESRKILRTQLKALGEKTIALNRTGPTLVAPRARRSTPGKQR